MRYIQTFTGKRFRPDDAQPDQLDIRDIARGLQHHLVHNPKPELGYVVNFGCFPHRYPVIDEAGHPDIGAHHEVEMVQGFQLMREILGNDEGRDMEEGG